MKLNTLQLKRALSAALFVLLLSVVGTKNALAQNQVATLQHNDTITGAFYGPNALVEAHAAVVDGDIITLSSGTFNCCNIDKAITIRGAGCVYNNLTQVAPTIVPGNFRINCSNIRFEGINTTGTISSINQNNVVFVKCTINNIALNYSPGEPRNRNWQFINCIIKNFASYLYTNGGLGSPCTASFVGMSIINSIVRFTTYNHTDIYSPNAINNSIVLFDNGQTINNIVAYNSIIASVSGHTVSNCTFFNSIGIKTGETSLFEGQIVQNVMEVNSYEDVFETFTGEVTYDNIYQLKEEIATTFLGNDGGEVGIYGGMMPYNTRPTYMIMKRCNVAPRSTIDNKLSVDIEVLTEEE